MMLTTVDIIAYLKKLVPYVYYGNMFRPEHPDACAIVSLSSGSPPNQYSNVIHPGFQVIVRGSAKGDAAAEAVAIDLLSKLHNLREIMIGGQRVVHIGAEQSVPFYLGPDENGRPLYSINFEMTMQS